MSNIDWYERRSELQPGMAFTDIEGGIVLLDRTVPGDGTKWYVADRYNGRWCYEDGTIEPGCLVSRIPEMDD